MADKKREIEPQNGDRVQMLTGMLGTVEATEGPPNDRAYLVRWEVPNQAPLRKWMKAESLVWPPVDASK